MSDILGVRVGRGIINFYRTATYFASTLLESIYTALNNNLLVPTFESRIVFNG